ncbi:hypothetical protein FQA39_LY03041 [Lamprigera yunnana]|nr:hypothetical protein FQA39_LY03041 [Lamprigera yunnana]
MSNSLERWKGKVAVVTGASSGIGAAVAKKLVEVGINVVGLARRKDKIEKLSASLAGKSAKLYGVKTDLTLEEDILNAFKWIKENVGPVHILINSAGIYRITTLVDGNTQMWRDTFNTNVIGLCIATREACRSMKNNNVNGHIVHVNSFTGHHVVHFPNSNVYPASKFAVTALTETLRQELNLTGSKTKITSVSPAGVDSEFGAASSLASGIVHTSHRTGIFLQPEDVADAIMYVLSTPPFVQIHELMVHSINEHF